uniref:Tctex1 domain containing 1 n=1 Tax=Xiphophorus couchianus TaxID=32473 RepID=A0A3B5LK50_9TELE
MFRIITVHFWVLQGGGRGGEKKNKANYSPPSFPLHSLKSDLTLRLTRPNKPFPITTISHILKEEITHRLRDVRYDPVRSREMTLTLCEVIRTRMKEFMISRYKTVILVHIGQLNGQGLQISSRCLWDPNFDTFVSHSFKNTSLFCSATVYGIYFE